MQTRDRSVIAMWAETMGPTIERFAFNSDMMCSRQGTGEGLMAAAATAVVAVDCVAFPLTTLLVPWKPASQAVRRRFVRRCRVEARNKIGQPSIRRAVEGNTFLVAVARRPVFLIIANMSVMIVMWAMAGDDTKSRNALDVVCYFRPKILDRFVKIPWFRLSCVILP